jgi:hypothetical protein
VLAVSANVRIVLSSESEMISSKNRAVSGIRAVREPCCHSISIGPLFVPMSLKR